MSDKLIVNVGPSGRHVHLSQEAADILFGKGYEFHDKRSLGAPGTSVFTEQVEMKGPRGTLKMGIVGPFRARVQAEVSFTDAVALGINPPVCESAGDDSERVTLSGPNGTMETNCAIVAARHVHLNEASAAKLGVKAGDTVKARLGEQRGLVLENVIVKVMPEKMFPGIENDLHIDYDEMNAAGLRSKPMVAEVFL